MGITTDRNDPDLGHGVDNERVPQNKKYLVTKESGEFIRPYRETYRHLTCGTTTSMNEKIAATYARNPKFYGATYCVHCQMHKPVSEFEWLDGERLGS